MNRTIDFKSLYIRAPLLLLWIKCFKSLHIRAPHLKLRITCLPPGICGHFLLLWYLPVLFRFLFQIASLFLQYFCLHSFLLLQNLSCFWLQRFLLRIASLCLQCFLFAECFSAFCKIFPVLQNGFFVFAMFCLQNAFSAFAKSFLILVATFSACKNGFYLPSLPFAGAKLCFPRSFPFVGVTYPSWAWFPACGRDLWCAFQAV